MKVIKLSSPFSLSKAIQIFNKGLLSWHLTNLSIITLNLSKTSLVLNPYIWTLIFNTSEALLCAGHYFKYLILSTVTREVILIILYLKMKYWNTEASLSRGMQPVGGETGVESRHSLPNYFYRLLHLFTINYDSLVLYPVFPSSWLMHYRHCSSLYSFKAE